MRRTCSTTSTAFNVKFGNQVLNTPWANASDSRLKPVAFQAADIAYKINANVTIEAIGSSRFQPRTTNDFLQTTLLTGAASELPYSNGGSATTYTSGFKAPPSSAYTGGWQYAKLGYANRDVTSNLSYYHFTDLAWLGWLDAKYTYSPAPLKPWIAIQSGWEKNVGSSIVGRLNSQVYGAQIGANITKKLAFTMAADVIPRHVENLPRGSVCTAATGQISPAQSYPSPGAGYFVGANVRQCIANPNGTYSVEYGGIASRYTDSYATDPLFTTSLTQGMIDRRAPGSSEKVAMTYTSTDKRLVLMVSRAWYDYGFNNFPDQTAETDGDATYYLRPLGKGPYHGFLLRYRYGVRTDDHSAAINVNNAPGVYFGSLPYFVYNRAGRVRLLARPRRIVSPGPSAVGDRLHDPTGTNLCRRH